EVFVARRAGRRECLSLPAHVGISHSERDRKSRADTICNTCRILLRSWFACQSTVAEGLLDLLVSGARSARWIVDGQRGVPAPRHARFWHAHTDAAAVARDGLRADFLGCPFRRHQIEIVAHAALFPSRPSHHPSTYSRAQSIFVRRSASFV